MPPAQDPITSTPLTSSGIYQIRHVASGKVYIGSAKSFRARWKNHRRELKAGIHHSRHLQRAWVKHGPDAFVFEVLQVVATESDLLVAEQEWIDRIKPFGRIGYNLHPTARSPLGIKRSDETRARMSAARIGIQFSATHCANISKAKQGHKRSAESCARQSQALMGRKRPKETVEKTASAHRGRKRSPETCKRISESLKGKKQKPTTVAKRAEKLKGNQHTKGYKHSDETRARMSEAQTKRHKAKADDQSTSKAGFHQALLFE